MTYQVTITFPNGSVVRTWEHSRADAAAFARRIANDAVRLDINQASVTWTIRAIEPEEENR